MNIQVINLNSARIRWSNCQKQLCLYSLLASRVLAVDGQNLSDDQVNAVYDAESNKKSYFVPLHSGEIGCFMSHRYCWRSIADGNDFYGMVLEDDFEILGPLKEFLSELEEKRIVFDILKLDRCSKGMQQEIHIFDCGIQLNRPALPPLDAAAYILSISGARKLVKALQRIYMPVDVHLQHWWKYRLNILCCNPPLIRQEPVLNTQSTLTTYKPPESLVQKFYRELKRPVFRYKLRYEALKRYHVKS